LALQLLLFGIVYPCVAGLDAQRQSLYFDLSALAFLALAASQLVQRFFGGWPAAKAMAPQPALEG